MKYVGWIYGDPEDFLLLKNLGVTGEMSYSPLGEQRTFTKREKRHFLFIPYWKKVSEGPPVSDVIGKKGYYENCLVDKKDIKYIKKNYPSFNEGAFSPVNDTEK